MKETAIKIENPLVIMFQAQGGDVICHLHPGNHTYQHYSILVCDLVRHVASAFKVDEDEVWEWVDKERYHPTSGIKKPQ